MSATENDPSKPLFIDQLKDKSLQIFRSRETFFNEYGLLEPYLVEYAIEEAIAALEIDKLDLLKILRQQSKYSPGETVWPTEVYMGRYSSFDELYLAVAVSIIYRELQDLDPDIEEEVERRMELTDPTPPTGA